MVLGRIHIRSEIRTSKFLIVGTYHPDTLYIREQGCEDPWSFFEARRSPRAKKCGKHCLNLMSWL